MKISSFVKSAKFKNVVLVAQFTAYVFIAVNAYLSIQQTKKLITLAKISNKQYDE